ncbi:DUF4123 domain-containing protein [Halocynthiibacter sp.]|uniref:DUF4123 domain-containing protein n=1 Tax=Halocynthiibacter sp. TaxID=1979210 RepID=UPI003C4DCE35
MSGFIAWVGKCHISNTADISDDTMPGQECYAAVWSDTREGFESALRVHISGLGLHLLWTEDVHTINIWLSQYGHNAGVMKLAKAVHAQHRVELGPFSSVGGEGEGPSPETYLRVTKIESVEPLDLQFGVHPTRTVPDALKEPLFGQLEPTAEEIAQHGGTGSVPSMRTYAILDAAKMPYLLTGLIESSGLRFESLFQGSAAEEFKEHCPYLVELSEDNSFTKSLFTGPDGVNGLWEKELGIYGRSRAEFDELRKHFRKFTRIQDAQGKWYYFKFWDATLFQGIVCEPNGKPPGYLAYLFGTYIVHSVILTSKCYSVSVASNPALHALPASDMRMLLDANSLNTISAAQKRKNQIEIARQAVEKIEKYTSYQPGEASEVALSSCKRFSEMGFDRRDHLTMLVSWDLIFGPDFETQYADGMVHAILSTKQPVETMFDEIKSVMMKA